MWFLAVLVALSAAVVPAATLVIAAASDQAYVYYTGVKEVKTLSPSIPVKFNGVPIHTLELNASDTYNYHNLSSGHHFGHRGWLLSATDGGRWEYNPNRAQAANKQKRQSDESITFTSVVITSDGGSAQSFADVSFSTGSEQAFSTDFGIAEASSFDWVDEALDATFDFFFDGDFVTASEALSGALDDIFLTAWAIFL
jgi:hypothetical protein